MSAESVRVGFRWLLAAAMVAVGVLHFVEPTPFTRIVPPWLPAPLLLVYVSGVFEVLGGVGVLVPRVRKWAGWGLVALYVAVFPANIYMAVYDIPMTGEHLHPVALWGRLLLQPLLVVWALWVTREPARRSSPRLTVR